MEPPCSEQGIHILQQGSAEELGAAPPAGYLDFLRQVDGLVFNGLSVYASVAKDDKYIEGFIEENIRRYRGDLQGFERTLVFAEDSLGFYALDIDRGVYRVESWGGIVIREFATFEELLEEALSTVTKDLDA
jgi:hypothetical protein